MLKVGLTGGIASGKSTVSERLRELGAFVIDYDQLARQVVEPGSTGLAQIAARFGAEVLDENGALNRPALGAIVFADHEKLRELEAITHPAIIAAASELQDAAAPGSIVVHDNPLLVEMNAAAACDVVVVVDTPQEQQVARMVQDRAMTEADALARIGAQIAREDRLAAADVVLENTGTLAELREKVDALWAQLNTKSN